MDTLLDVKNLAVDFATSEGTVHAVRGIDFSVKKGEVLGIVGESGCGKSVTSLAVMGLLPAVTARIPSGEILFDGRDLLTLAESERQDLRGNDISMIFQEPMTALNPVLTIGEQLGEVLEVHRGLKLGSKENFDQCVENLAAVGIPRAEEVMREYPHQFSGGMRQRIMIAMALSCNPKLLIADEPTTALDVTIQAQILDLLRNLKQQLGTAIMFITHDLGVIHEMADSVMVMYAGEVVEKAPTAELFRNPRHPYTKGLMKSRPGQVGRGEQLYCIPGMVPSGKEMPTGCSFCPRCDYAMDKCKNVKPKLVEIAEGHSVACHLMGMEDGHE